MYCTKIIIPKISNTYKLYVYCSKHPDYINTIAKVKTIQPTIIIDESIAKTQEIDGKLCYVVYDSLNATKQDGVKYLGPTQNLIPITEYETSIDIISINNYTFVNQLIIDVLPINHNGTMLYYSVIGVNESSGTITHLSKVNGIMVEPDYQEGTRLLYSCNDYTGKDTDIWNYVCSVAWDEKIKIGNINDTISVARFGIPIVENVNIFSKDDISVSTRPLTMNNFITIEIPNPWQRNNKKYNFRKLKSYKIQNVYDKQYGDFSEPTYQSLLPVSIEKMLIIKAIDPKKPDNIIPIEYSFKDGYETYQIIRKDGIYYNSNEHRKLGLNKYSIPLEEKIGIFSESSMQDKIKMQISALPNHVYSFSIYLFDVYGNVSNPVHFVVRT